MLLPVVLTTLHDFLQHANDCAACLVYCQPSATSEIIELALHSCMEDISVRALLPESWSADS